ncbi:MAG: DNA polymerase I [Endomicrobiales bacterium]
MPKLYIIDANAYVHRAYHAVPPLSTSKGEMVNAVYGFLRMLLKLLRTEKPEYLAVCFDYPAATFRHLEFPAYKANRRKMDDELKQQMPLAREAVRVLNLPLIEMQGYEADDLIATLARQAEKGGADVVVVSGDKDALQLVNGKITVWNEGRNITYDREKVHEKYGLYPENLVDMFALMGDAADNVPGIKGVGEKTAVRLVQKYGSLENILKNADEIEGKLQETVRSGAGEAGKSKKLVTLCDTVPLETSWEKCRPGTPDEKTVIDFLCRFEFTSLLKEIVPEKDSACVNVRERKFKTTILSAANEIAALVQNIEAAPRLSFDLETTGLDPYSAEIVGISLALDAGEGFYLPVGHRYMGAPQQPDRDEVIGALKGVLENSRIRKYGHNIKYDLTVIKRYGVALEGVHFDTMVASYCLNPSRNSHGLKSVALDYLGFRMTGIEELIGKGAKQITMDQVEVERAAQYAAADAVAVLMLAENLEPQLAEKKLDTLFHKVEMPLVEILADMEQAGLKVDFPYLEGLSKEFAALLRGLEKEIFRLAGQEFNPNSPRQLAVILFEKLKLPVIRRTKTGYSTDEEVLRALSAQHALPGRLIEYRELQKLKSTYIDALLKAGDPATHRVHTSFNQAVTATGRLSSSEPNLQNIPVRTEYGRMIRKAFVPERGKLLLSADYSQIDLRVLAHISQDTALIEAFRKGEDIHSATAHEVFNVPLPEVTKDMRRIAKTINFGIVYGMSAFSLAQQLGLSNAQAKEYIDSYFKRYHGVRDWMGKIVEEARASGYVATLLGRIRYLPDIRSTNGQVRGFAERTALNTPIQGTSADIIKLAMIEIHRALSRERPGARMLVQVHDELLFEVPEAELGTISSMVKYRMESALKLDVPLVADLKTGHNWAVMEPWQGKEGKNSAQGVPEKTGT